MCTPGICGAGSLCYDADDVGSGCEDTRGCLECHFGGLGGSPVQPVLDSATAKWTGTEGYITGFVVKNPEKGSLLKRGDYILKTSVDGKTWQNVEAKDHIISTRTLTSLFVDVWHPDTDIREVVKIR